MSAVVLTLWLAASAGPIPPVWNPQERTEATECDRLASGRYDRERLAQPVAREEIDVPVAIRQCEADLAAHPGDARLHFHLGRLYGYAGDRARSLQNRQAAAAKGDPNAIFLLAYLEMSAKQSEAARCDAGSRMRLAADRGNYSAQIAYSMYVLEGRFDACKDPPTTGQLLGYLKAARPRVDGFFETLLAEHLLREAQARETSP